MPDKAPDTAARSKVTALLPVCNEQENIEACLDSVAWADEVFVVDSFSSDATVEIARRRDARVVQHEYVNSAAQKNWAIPRATHPWVLIVDADERVTPELRDEILDVLRRDAAGQSPDDGYRISRLNHFLGQRIRYCGWQNDTCLRLFRRDKGRYQTREVHADVIVDGTVGRLRGRLLHYTFTGFDQYMRKFDRYTSWAAGDRDRVTGPVRWRHLALRPIGRFFKQYVLKRGFLDGTVGLIVCTLAAFSVFMKYAKLYERRIQPPAESKPAAGSDAADKTTLADPQP
jgi:glycosyltransferase involved in cell wall biosynthesis